MDSTPLPRRRDFLQTTGMGLLSWPVMQSFFGSTSTALAQTAATAPAAAVPALNRFPRMMQDWLVTEVRAAEQRGNAGRDALKTKADAEAYVKSVQERIRQCFGPLPEKTPLNARVTKTLERDGYRIENIVFESRPNFLVTGNLYLPTNRQGPVPGVIGVCGHSLNGKAAEAYQSFAQGLARQGQACFIIDPAGQGERFQYLNEKLGSRLGGGTSEHNQMGGPQALIGEFLGTWFVWDAMRALDYLLTRKEIDPQHLGVTGNSGGGTQTTWLCGMESRFTMGAPSCFVTTFRRDAENELPQDMEQCPPRVLAHDLDHCDFLAAMAPKPVIIMAQEKDYFDARGSAETYERLKKLYTLLGKPENIQLHIGPDPHGYTQSNREAMYRFFGKVTGIPSAATEPTITVEKDADLLCTPRGQVAEAGSRTLMSFTREKADDLAAKRKHLTGEALQKAVRDVLKLPALADSPPDYRILRSVGARKYPTKAYCTYAVETEPMIHALVTRLSDEALTSRLPRGLSKAVLYISHRSADAELRDDPFVQELIASAPNAAFFACDVRGIGDSQPNTCGANQFLGRYGSHYFYAAYSQMLDRPLLGQRTFDVLRVIQLLAAAGHTEIHLAGQGWGALPAAFAALLSREVKQVTLKHALTSFHELAVHDDQQWPTAFMLPQVLQHFDLPDCYVGLKSRNLRLFEPWGAADGMK
ncbi:prolyl oligopeptidase family serine peptidase [Prosthecobacter sp.]|uniref:alpha/beta hydrolase family protein n=1 Tax=Prosthecobacter sp. TaxID=1965333 RepID=UPI002ABB59AA|nr:prolyl oligopeptidase family serine peptidase [Prosthecobacter sp.]MDZ4403474.1 prolyl oligopeptidase family serine peptidase [Prosthecobacter sp.]